MISVHVEAKRLTVAFENHSHPAFGSATPLSRTSMWSAVEIDGTHSRSVTEFNRPATNSAGRLSPTKNGLENASNIFAFVVMKNGIMSHNVALCVDCVVTLHCVCVVDLRRLSVRRQRHRQSMVMCMYSSRPQGASRSTSGALWATSTT